MFHVAVCDNDAKLCSQIEGLILDYAERTQKAIKVEVFLSGKDFIKRITKSMYFDLVFLDINLGDCSGIDIGRYLRETLYDNRIHIIYISGLKEKAIDLIKTRPFNFLIKPLKEREILINLKNSMDVSQKEEVFFEFQAERTFYKICLKEVLYFASNAKKIRVVTSQGYKEFYGKLTEIEDLVLKKDFIRIHKSYLVNIYKIKGYKTDSVFVMNGDVLPISRSFQSAVKEKFNQIDHYFLKKEVD